MKNTWDEVAVSADCFVQFSFHSKHPEILFHIVMLNLDLYPRINSTIQILEHKEALRTSNALEIMSKYPFQN